MMEPPGFRCSNFAYISTSPRSIGKSSFSVGVFPMARSGGYCATNARKSAGAGNPGLLVIEQRVKLSGSSISTDR